MSVSANPTPLERLGPERTVQVSVVIPCLNEAENIQECVGRSWAVLRDHGIAGEVIVVDNGSNDESAELARAAGARVVDEPRRGYGQAYLAGFEAARGDYIVMIDADLTYDFDEIPRFVRELDGGAELVMGNRMQGIQPGAMSIVSRIGNPILSGFLNLLYRSPIGDAHCGMRAFRRDILPALELQSTGMEFASEMVIRAVRKGLAVREVPIRLHPRGGESKLSPLRDGWRHLRLMLVYSPNFLFLLPGALMVLLGTVLMVAVVADVPLFGRNFFVHTQIVASGLLILGLQVTGLGLCARAYGVFVLGERDAFLERMKERFRLEHGLLLGAGLFVAGLALVGVLFGKWAARGYGALAEERLAILAATLALAGMQIVFTSFLISILGLRRKPRA